MKNLAWLLIILLVTGTSCSSSSFPGNLFNKKTAREKYEDQLDKQDLDQTPEGKLWLAAAGLALSNPQLITLPYRLEGKFSAARPAALGLKFQAKRGEKLMIHFNKPESFVLYADLFHALSEDPVLTADTAHNDFSFDVAESGEYMLRIQPELFRGSVYELSISIGPSLAFPVAGNKGHAGSFWGDERDGGKRSHEGVDIFAPKRTPVVAAADGYIGNVREGGLGGKTVSMIPSGKNISLYYAHLDQQLVHTGQQVKLGDTIGLVGNTGNARNTPSHLHFGIYSFSGAIDPLPFIDPTIKAAPAIAHKNNLGQPVHLLHERKAPDGSLIGTSQTLLPLGVDAKNYFVQTQEGKVLEIPLGAVSEKRLKGHSWAG
ncbi:MAG: M23 family metallopeptidase [Flavisolibacter sp.]